MANITEGSELLLPEALSRTIIQNTTQNSALLSMATTTRLPARTQRVPVLDVLPVAYWVDGQPTQADNDQGWKNDSRADWANVTLTAEELAVILPFHENDINDSAFDLEAEALRLIPEAMGNRIDAAGLFGTDAPTSWGTGIVAQATAAGNAYESPGTADVAADINETFALVENDGYMVNGVMSRIGMKSKLRGLRGSDGQPVFTSSLRDDGRVDAIYDEPLSFLTNGAWNDAAADMVVGDWTKAIVGIRQDITLKRFDTGVIQDPATGNIIYNLLQQDMVAVRAVMRVAFATANPVTRLNATAGTRYPFGALVDLV